MPCEPIGPNVKLPRDLALDVRHRLGASERVRIQARSEQLPELRSIEQGVADEVSLLSLMDLLDLVIVDVGLCPIRHLSDTHELRAHGMRVSLACDGPVGDHHLQEPRTRLAKLPKIVLIGTLLRIDGDAEMGVEVPLRYLKAALLFF